MSDAWPDTFFRLDDGGTILEYGTRNKSDLFSPPESFLGKRIQDIAPSAVAERFREGIEHVSKKKSPTTVEYRLLEKGVEKTFEARLLPTSDRKIIAILRNITESKKTEEKWERSFSLLKATLESTADGLVVVDIDGKVVDFNQKFLDMWRIPFAMITTKSGKEVRNYVAPQLKDPESFVIKADELLHQSKGTSLDILEFKDGRIFERQMKPQYMASEMVGRVFSFRDITEQKKLENMIVQSEKMSAVGQLAGGVAHEINNPLGIILGFAQSLKSQADVRGESNVALAYIEREALRCKELVQNLLVFSRTSRIDHRENVDVCYAVEEALSLVTAQTRVKNIKLTKEFSADLPSIYANKTQLQQVIINLCNNAIDAMTKGGSIVVKVNKCVRGGADSISIQISDTGPGIPKSVQAKMFEPFFTTKEVGKGTGLGLSLVYEIIQKHQGAIDVESEEGKGATFTIYVPCHLSEIQEVA